MYVILFFLNKNSQSKLETVSEAIFTEDIEDIFKFLIQNGEEAIELARVDTMWRISGNDTLDIKSQSMDNLFDKIGMIDAFRVVNQQAEQYTWWSNRGQAWAKNIGWRIDYQVVTPGLKNKIKGASIYKDERFSDHAPLIIDYDWTIT